ncbi:hypothetical protein CMI47_05195 [Candidatus Pacearchaeota archaeon]|jgi:phage-related protein|nr:hypothetical protein [Candidatus Pacearchaeota archaeon]|tara:strand:- start:7658 stop:9673 length:2016 start_codon:yes stop_codon:yes gene_type:complete
MALGDVIARLAVNLSLETAAFEKGATKSEKRMNQMRRKFSDFSKSIAIGAAGIGTAIAGINKVFGDLAQKSKEMGNAAQVAGESFEDFQRQAYGARMVGVEFDKLGDIFKDVRDRIGDFAQTGGGPMADFFENIAPKVGVTAKAFEGLGGRDSLQLYYDSLKKANVSQEDMVFYLEAMASDATNLIPLLENGGAAWERYGDKAAVITEDQRAQLQRYEESMAKLDNSLQQLALTLVDSGLIDKFANFAEQLAAVTEGFSGVSVAANAADEEMKKTEGARKFGSDLRALSDSINEWYLATDKAFADAGAGIRNFFVSVWDGFNRWWTDLKATAAQLAQVGKDMVAGLVSGIKSAPGAVGDALVGIASSGLAKVKNFLGIKSPSRVFMEIGGYISEGLAIGIEGGIGRVNAAVGKMTEAAKQAARETQALLDRLFPEVRKMLDYERELQLIGKADLSDDAKTEARLRLGRERDGRPVEGGGFTVSDSVLNAPSLIKGMEEVGDSLKGLGDKAKVQTVRIAETFKDMAESTLAAVDRMANAIKGGGFLDILSGVVGLGIQLGSIGAFGKSIQANINKGIPGYATGTRNHPGGLAIVGERGPELVSMPRGSSVFTNSESRAMMGGRGGNTYNFSGNLLTPEFWDRINAGDMAAAQGGAQAAAQNSRFAASRSLRR